MSMTVYKYFSGGFSASFDPYGSSTSPTAFDLGTTEEGIRILTEPDVFPITEDRLGSTIVDYLFLGYKRVECFFESLTFATGSTLKYLWDLSNAPMTPAAGITAAGTGQDMGLMAGANLGMPMLQGANGGNGIWGTLTLTAITGRLIGSGTPTPMSIAMPCAIPLENIEMLLTLRRPISVPFRFQILPDFKVGTDFTTGGNLRYWTIVYGNAS